MYDNFKLKHPNFQISYNVYRLNVKKLNISSATLGCEECFSCETFKLHRTGSKHDGTNLDCEICTTWKIHNDKYYAARQEYQRDASVAAESNKEVFVSADLQKV